MCEIYFWLSLSPAIQGAEWGEGPSLRSQVGEQFVHEYSEKQTACRYTIPYSSAHSDKMKMAELVEDGLQRLRNYSQGLEWEKKRLVMASYAMKLKRSGYPLTIRHQVIKTVCLKYDKMCEDERNGVRPIHRPRNWKSKERRLEKERKLTRWHQTEQDKVSAPQLFQTRTIKFLTFLSQNLCQSQINAALFQNEAL